MGNEKRTEPHPHSTEIIIIGSDGCYSKLEIAEGALDHFVTSEEKAEFIARQLVESLEAMKLERDRKGGSHG